MLVLNNKQMIETLIQYFKKPKEDTKDKTPEGLCPNCWGSQEYDNMVRDLYEDKQIDINNQDANHAFIQDFIITQVQGIKLVKGNNSFECPTCRTKYN